MFQQKVTCFALVLALMSAPVARALMFEECELALAMNEYYPREMIDDWVCLIMAESGGNSSAVGGPNTNGSFDWGLFQVNDGWWCGPGKDCNIACEDLINDDISDDITCANLVYDRQGFIAWHGWERKCMNQTMPSMDHCFPDVTTQL